MARVGLRRTSFAVIGAIASAAAICHAAGAGDGVASTVSRTADPISSAKGGFGPSYGAAAANCPVKHTRSGLISQNGLSANFGRKATVAATAEDRPRPPGTHLGEIGRDGVIRLKVPWFREPEAYGRLRVSAEHRRSHEVVHGGYGNHLGPTSEVVPGRMLFASEGCWRITATSGAATLKTVVWVVNIDEGRRRRH